MKKNKLKFLAVILLATFTFVSYQPTNETAGKTINIKTPSQVLRLTYVTKLINDYENSVEGCKQISTFIDKDLYKYDTEILDDVAVKNKFSEVINNSKDSEILLSELKDVMKKNEIKMVDSLCTKDGQVFITLLTYINNSESLIIATWDNEKKQFSLSKPLKGLMDFYHVFVPYGLKNRHLFRIGYGDAGTYVWVILSLDPKNNVYRVLEKCRGGYEYDGEKGNFTDKFKMRCAREYKPIKKHK